MASIITATTTGGLTQSADNSGVLQLASGAGNLVTVPSVTGTMITTASSSQSIPKAALPTGSVLQVVQGTTSTQTSTTSVQPTFVDTGLTASITPTSSSSKILVIAQIASPAKYDANTTIYMRLVRGSTTILDVGKGWIANNNSTGTNGMTGCPLNYLDSPATTSSTTYKVQFCTESGGTVLVQGSSTTSTIILMEIAA